MPVSLAFERTHNILLVQFSGSMNQEGLNCLDSSVVAFVKKQGPTRGFVIDCSGVEHFDVPTGEFVRRGQRASVVSNQQRVYVMPREDMYGLGRMFGSYQRIVGHHEPIIVKTLLEAFSVLNLADPDFEPLAGPAPGGEERPAAP